MRQPLAPARRHVHIGVDVVGKAVQQHHDRPVRGSRLVIGDVENAGFDMMQRLEPMRGRRARAWSSAWEKVGSMIKRRKGGSDIKGLNGVRSGSRLWADCSRQDSSVG